MLIPLFDKNSELVAWLEPDKHIFDTSMRWIAFIKNGHVCSADDANWLGAIDDSVCMDRLGRVFAWVKGAQIRGSIRPVTPVRPTRPVRPITHVRPVAPVRPVTPVRPLHGWSSLSLSGWLNQ